MTADCFTSFLKTFCILWWLNQRYKYAGSDVWLQLSHTCISESTPHSCSILNRDVSDKRIVVQILVLVTPLDAVKFDMIIKIINSSCETVTLFSQMVTCWIFKQALASPPPSVSLDIVLPPFSKH